ncbi:MMS19 nucleotide excision repair protein-like protein [Bienertia sinuspersici]
MDPQNSLVKHIESFVDSSSSSAQQSRSVNSVASLLKNDIITLEYLVKEMEMYLTTTDHILRARGLLLLAEVLTQLQLKRLDDTTIHTLVGFFTERLADWRAVRGALVGCLALVKRKHNAGVVVGSDAKKLAQSFLENLQVQSLGQNDRKLCFELLECLLNCFQESIAALGDHLVYGVCEAIDGEKDPQCLMHVFNIVESLAKLFPDPSGPVAMCAEDLFDIIGRYFPIHYTHVDSLKYLSYCATKYGPERIAKHAEAIWSSLKAAAFNLPTEDISSWVSDSSTSMGFQDNDITKEALNLLQNVASQPNNGFLNLVLKDKTINDLINSFAVLGNSGFVPPRKSRNFASTTSCNMVFDAVFVRLLDDLGVSANTSVKEVPITDSNLPCQKLNFSVLYLCIDMLDGCRELSATSARLSSNANFVNDAWCQTLAGFSSSLMKALVSGLVPSTDEMHDDADISLRVKGLQILATFPGDFAPVSLSTFENIMVILVSIVTHNFNLAILWKVSLNALAEIGTFLNEFPYSEKLVSYMSTAVEKLILLISLDDSTMPFSLLLEALTEISASGPMFSSRIIHGVQEALSAKFAKVDGDVKKSAELVQLLDCYSMKLLPRFHTFKGSDSVPLQLAIDIWGHVEAALGSNHSVERKQLLNATKMALKVAVAMVSEEDQQRIVEKAFEVISSNLSFSSTSVPSKLEGLHISEDTDNVTCRDEWLTSLFASIIIALRPKIQIANLRTVIELLLAAFLKGHVTAAQALGSIVNKMPLKNNDMQDSGYFHLDDALALILERSLRSYSDRYLLCSSDMCDSEELFSSVADCVPLQIHCISGLAWICKGLLMRGHEKLKDITMIFVRCIVSSSELETLTQNKGWSEREREVLPLLTKSAVDAFHVLMSDSEDCLNKTFHATVRPLHKQRFLSIVMPILLSAAKKTHTHTVRSLIYRAIGHVISNTPLAAVLTETKKLLPVLLDVIAVLSEDILNKDMIYNLLLVFSGLLMDKNGQDIAVENAHAIINCLIGLLSYPHKMLVRETAIQCLAAVSGMPHARIYPMRIEVLRALSKVLDDPKRTVRQEAVRCLQAWSSIA